MNLEKNKREAREKAELQRKEVHEKIAVSASRKVASLLEKFLQKDKRADSITTVAAYISIKTELNLQPSIESLIRLGKRVCLPIIVDQNQPLIFKEWDGKRKLIRGKFNVPVPTSRFSIEPDLLICPLLSYDSAGFRLGYGGGFYDRTIASLQSKKKTVLTLGCGYSEQLSKKMLPINEYDKRLNAVITEKGLFFFCK